MSNSGNMMEYLDQCSNCNEQTMDSLEKRNIQCLNVCGNRLSHGYANIKPICKCEPRTKIKPCTSDDDYENKKYE